MLLPTADVLKNDYLFGIPLTDEDGNIMQDSVLAAWIERAIAWLETELMIKIAPTSITESHDYYLSEYVNFCYVQLYQYPVISVTSLKASYAGQDIMTFPSSWIRIYKESGQLQLVPTTGNLSQVLLSQGSGVLLPLITNKLSGMPHLFTVNYTAGFPSGQVPADICDLIAMKAVIGVMNILGDILLGAGIASQSLSIDGLSESINTTQSAENSAYSARVRQYEKQIQTQLPNLRAKYKGIKMTVA
jgi:hypothetical protein